MTFGSSRANIGEFDSESSSTSLPRELQEVLSLRRQLWASGYRPVAVYSPSAQVVSAGKRPMGDRWQERARANPPEAATILPQPIGLNTGILCDGLRAIDIDIDDPSLAEGIERLAAQKLGCAPVRWRADSPRCLLLYRAAEGLPPKRQRKGEAGKIEVLGCGQQFVAYGTHPGGQIYQWRPADPAPWSRDGLPAITEAQLDGFLEATAALLGDNPSAQENATSYSDARHQHHGTNGPDATERERAYAIKALEAEVAQLTNTRSGRNQALNDAALRLGEMVGAGWIERITVEAGLWEASSRNGYRAKDGNAQASATLQSGLNAGIKNPRPPITPVYAPQPLRRELPPALPFPIDALGDTLGRAVDAIVDKVQCPPAIAALSVLGAASLAAQAHADVVIPATGHCKPLSLFLLSIGASGERKSAADREALRPVVQREAELLERHAAAHKDYLNQQVAWQSAHDKAKKDAKGDYLATFNALTALGPAPVAPLTPMLTCPEPTFEGLCRLFAHGHPALGLFSDEGGQFVGGHGLSPDNKLRTIAGLSGLWDGSPIKRVRVGDGASVLPGRRLAMHLMVQPEIAMGLLSDPLLKDQGFLSRLLVSSPASTAGTRFQKAPRAESEMALRAYTARILEILRRQPPLVAGQLNELDPRQLTFDPEATALWVQYADYVEGLLAAGQAYEPIRGFANKLPEQAARIAGVFTLIDNIEATSINQAVLYCATRITEHFASEAIRLFDAGMVDSETRVAEELRHWLQTKWVEPFVGLKVIYQFGPNSIRTAAKAKKAVALLVEHGCLVKASPQTIVAGARVKEAWQVIRDG